ncbi:MAG TPA: M48 family metalloprotease, partial [Thermoanaerobaculia bacterium]
NARNEGEVAGVLAHEISHVALRHGTHQASKAYLAQAGISILGGILGGRVGQGTADVINAVGGLGLNALFLKYSRDLESQADVRGAQILAASGYSPADMVNFFKTLERVDPSKKTNWLSDHPAPPDRIARIEKEAQMLRVSATPTTNVAELRQVQTEMSRYGGARTGQPIAQAAAASGRARSTRSASSTVSVPAPSASYRTYTNENGLYRLSYPSNWQVYESNGPGVMIAPPGGAGDVNGKSEIVYGAIINHYDPFGNAPATNISPQSATQDLVAAVEQSSPYLRARSISGHTAVLRGTDPVTGVAERVTVVTRQLSDEHLLYVLFVTPERDAASYSKVLNTMVNSLQINTNQPH